MREGEGGLDLKGLGLSPPEFRASSFLNLKTRHILSNTITNTNTNTKTVEIQIHEGGGGGVGLEGLGLEPPRAPSLLISLTHKSENSQCLDISTILSREERKQG